MNIIIEPDARNYIMKNNKDQAITVTVANGQAVSERAAARRSSRRELIKERFNAIQRL